MQDASDSSALSDPSRIVSFDSSTLVYSIYSTDNSLGAMTVTIILTATATDGASGSHQFDIVTTKGCAAVQHTFGLPDIVHEVTLDGSEQDIKYLRYWV